MPNQPASRSGGAQKAYKFPTYNVIGQAKMHDGKDVLIMSEKQWDMYCYEFN